MILHGDARALAFADLYFDAVVSLLCLHNIEVADERGRACAEIAQVLRSIHRKLAVHDGEVNSASNAPD